MKTSRRSAFSKAGVVLALLVVGAARAADPPVTEVGHTPVLYTVRTAAAQTFADQPVLAALGRRIFEDASLSEPRGLGCASCHEASRGLSSTRIASRGVAEGSVRGRFGIRNVPALRYARYTPPLYFFSDEPDEDPTPQPRGGLLLDGRVDTLAEQPSMPLLDPREMNNPDRATVARKLRAADYASQLRAVFGARSLDDPDAAMKALGAALQAYLQSDALSPFSSRYDAFIAGRGKLTPLETKGLALFRDPLKGNCGSCHEFNPDSSNPRRSMFTDYGYDAVGAPRNAAIPALRHRDDFDLGLCGTAAAKGWPNPGQWCGYFRTPSLRNVALRERFMHNGVFTDLRTVVEFYASRSTYPSRWYPRGVRFDDLPARYRVNVNVMASPWNRRPGSRPGLDADEVEAVVAFLGTLTDGDLEGSSKHAARDIAHP